MCYSITSRKSFERLNYWKNLAEDVVNKKKILIVIVGNKSDLYNDEEVNEEEGIEYAQKNNATHKLVSAKNGTGINDLFEEVSKNYIESGANLMFENKSLNLSTKILEKNKTKCCH